MLSLFLIFLISACTHLSSQVVDTPSFKQWASTGDTQKVIAVLPFTNETKTEDLNRLVREGFYEYFSVRLFHDIEIYDAHRLVYAQKQIPDDHFTVAGGIPGCKTYRWSVRPSYHVGDDIKYGQWMSSRSLAETTSTNGVFGREASEAPAYTQDFALLKIACGKK